MSLLKALKFMFVMTTLALIYINMQMQTFSLAYQGKTKEKQIRKLSDDNGLVNYEILTLKSANHLGARLLNDKSDMQFLDQSKVVKIHTVALSLKKKNQKLEVKNTKKVNPVISFLSLISQAEAWPEVK